MYICTYVSVTLRNVNLRSHSETQASLIRVLHKDAGTTFLGDAGQGGQCGNAQFLTPALRAPPACAMRIDTLAYGAARGIIRMCTPSNIASRSQRKNLVQ